MGKMFLKILAVLMAAVLIVGMTGCSETVEETPTEHTHETTPDTTEAVSTPAPDFTMYDAEGNAYRLSEFQGKPVILNFWATWCGPCKNELPEIQAAYEEYGDDIHFLIVDLADGQNETVEQASAYVADQGYTFPVYFDTEMDGAVTYGVNSIPMTYFIDGDGNLVAYYLGSMDEAILQQGIDMVQ